MSFVDIIVVEESDYLATQNTVHFVDFRRKSDALGSNFSLSQIDLHQDQLPALLLEVKNFKVVIRVIARVDFKLNLPDSCENKEESKLLLWKWRLGVIAPHRSFI